MIPIQKYVSLNTNKAKEHSKAQEFLPHPLYIFYSHVSTYLEVSGKKNIVANVLGDVDEAKKLIINATEKQDLNNLDESELYKKHPLSVSLIFTVSSTDKMTVTFNYLVNLEIVVVSTETTLGDNLLTNLYPNDTGEETPNLANKYQYTGQLQFSPSTGFAYRWAQFLCDKGTYGNVNAMDTNQRYKMEDVLSKIEARAQSKKSVTQQMQSFTRGKIPVAHKQNLHIRSVATLSSWTSISASEFINRRKSKSRSSSSSSSSSRKHKSRSRSTESSRVEEGELEEGAVEEGELASTETASKASSESPPKVDNKVSKAVSVSSSSRHHKISWERLHCSYYKGIFKMDNKDQLEVLVEISPEYPVRSPCFKLRYVPYKRPSISSSLPSVVRDKCKSSALDAVSRESPYNNITKQLEIDINMHYEEVLPKGVTRDELLTYLMRKLKTCMEILVELEKRGNDSVLTNILGRPYRGPDRRPPFSMLHALPM